MARLTRPLGTAWARVTSTVIYLAMPVPYDALGHRALGRPGHVRGVPVDRPPPGPGVACGALRRTRRRRRRSGSALSTSASRRLDARSAAHEPVSAGWRRRRGHGCGRRRARSPHRALARSAPGVAALAGRMDLVARAPRRLRDGAGAVGGARDLGGGVWAWLSATSYPGIGGLRAAGRVAVVRARGHRGGGGAPGAVVLRRARRPERWQTLAGLPVPASSGAGWGELLRLAVGPIGDAALAWAFLAAAALPLLIGSRWRLAWAGRAWSWRWWPGSWPGCAGRGGLGPLGHRPPGAPGPGRGGHRPVGRPRGGRLPARSPRLPVRVAPGGRRHGRRRRRRRHAAGAGRAAWAALGSGPLGLRPGHALDGAPTRPRATSGCCGSGTPGCCPATGGSSHPGWPTR